VQYVNVLKDPEGVDGLLKASKGRRVVPVIVEANGLVIIGFGGS